MSDYSSEHSGAEIDGGVNRADQLTDNYIKNLVYTSILNTVYPIGSIYMSVNSVSPSTFLGGTWERISDKFLLAAGSSYGAGTTGGAANHTPSGSVTTTVGAHTLTSNEVPMHTHTRGTMDITGTVVTAHSPGICFFDVASPAGAFSVSGSVTNIGKPSLSSTTSGNNTLNFAASRNWTGETSSAGGGESHNHTGTSTFTGTSQNTMPPYMAVYIWRRTA